jgi:hypothetical protein
VSAYVVRIPAAEFHFNVDFLPVGLEAFHANSRTEEGRPEIQEHAYVAPEDFLQRSASESESTRMIENGVRRGGRLHGKTE